MELDKGKIVVDSMLRTNVADIFAAGGLCGGDKPLNRQETMVADGFLCKFGGTHACADFVGK